MSQVLSRAAGIEPQTISGTPSYRTRAQAALLVSLLNPTQITGNGDMYHDATMTVQESISRPSPSANRQPYRHINLRVGLI